MKLANLSGTEIRGNTCGFTPRLIYGNPEQDVLKVASPEIRNKREKFLKSKRRSKEI